MKIICDFSVFYLDETLPKGSIGVECGEALLKHGYKLKFFNTINFSKSMRYNPMAYIHSEKDVLKLVTALMTNTKKVRAATILGQSGTASARFADRIPPLRSPCRGAKLRNIAGNAKHYINRSVLKKRAACIGTVQNEGDWAQPNKHFATQNGVCIDKSPACHNNASFLSAICNFQIGEKRHGKDEG